jgi:hypothetical protein
MIEDNAVEIYFVKSIFQQHINIYRYSKPTEKIKKFHCNKEYFAAKHY